MATQEQMDHHSFRKNCEIEAGATTEGHRYQLVVRTDARFRSRKTGARQRLEGVSRNQSDAAQQEHNSAADRQASADMRHNSVSDEHSSATAGRKRSVNRSSSITAEELGETRSFVERCRFVRDHGSKETTRRLVSNRITLQQAQAFSRVDREAREAISVSKKRETLADLLIEFLADQRSKTDHHERVFVRAMLKVLLDAEKLSPGEAKACCKAMGVSADPTWGAP